MPRSLSITRALSLMTIFGFASGCATSPQVPDDAKSSVHSVIRRCGPSSPTGRQAVLPTELPPVQSDRRLRKSGTSELSKFSPQALDIADIIGVGELVAQIPALEEAARSLEGAVRLLVLRQQITDRILLAFLEVARTASEADCEEERADQLADRLQDARDRRVQHLTVFAIVGGALVGVLGGALTLADHETAAGIGEIFGGSLETAFGTGALFVGTKQEFRHERNLLREVWEGPSEPSLFPSSVWRFLNRPLPDDPRQQSLRETLIARWYQHGRFGKPGSETERRRIALFFGDGGRYEIEDLRARAAMLDLLEADISLMSQDLERLMQEVLGRTPARAFTYIASP